MSMLYRIYPSLNFVIAIVVLISSIHNAFGWLENLIIGLRNSLALLMPQQAIFTYIIYEYGQLENRDNVSELCSSMRNFDTILYKLQDLFFELALSLCTFVAQSQKYELRLTSIECPPKNSSQHLPYTEKTDRLTARMPHLHPTVSRTSLSHFSQLWHTYDVCTLFVELLFGTRLQLNAGTTQKQCKSMYGMNEKEW